MKPVILITGASGFVGTHLVEHLQVAWPKATIHGTTFKPIDNTLESLLPTNQIHELNLLESNDTDNLISQVKPDHLIHLAALSSAGSSFTNPQATLQTNINAQLNLFQALINHHLKPITLIIGSAEEYGHVLPEELPISETNPLRPLNPYAVSKITQDYLGLQYFLSHKLPIIRLRPFNHTGERQPDHFVVPAFAKQLAQIEVGLQEPILKTGNLDVSVDFTDVKDIVAAYTLALTQATPGEVYNLGSGQAVHLKHMLKSLIGLTNLKVTIQKDPARFRPTNHKTHVCDSSKFHHQTGWQPAIPFSQTLTRVLDYWRGQVNSSKSEK